MQTVKVAVIGAGQMGVHHVRNYFNQFGVEFVGIVDQDELRLRQLKEKFPINTYTDFREIIDLVDAVSIVTPTTTHFEIAKEFLKRGKHVLLEKPMASNLSEANKLIEIAKTSGSILEIGHIERFNPVMNELKAVLMNNKPLFIDIHRESPYDSRIFDTDVIMDLMIHDIDLLLYILKENIDLKSAVGMQSHSAKSDLVNAQLISTSGVLINITASRVTEQKLRQWRIILPNCLIEVDLIERKLYITKRTSVAIEIQENGSEIKYRQEQLVEKIVVPNYEPLQMEILDFLSAIRNETQPKVRGEDGYNALKIIGEIQTSISKKLIVRKAV